MAFIRRIKIEALFGLYEHDIELRTDSPVTIVAGPNGIGKTTLLSLTRNLLTGNYREVVRHSFARLTVESQSGGALIAKPLSPIDEDADGEPRLYLEMRHGGRKTHQAVLDVPRLPRDLALPAYVEPHGRDAYFDSRLGDVISVDEAIARYGRLRPGARARVEADPLVPEWFQPDDWLVDFIETKRLDTLISRGLAGSRRREPAPAPIDVYLSNVRRALEEARRQSTLIRQQRDRTYVRRLLERAGENVNERELRNRYSRVEALAEQLQANGLLSDSLEVLQSGKLTPTNKRVVNLFLDDFEAKLQPLLPVSRRLEQLRMVIGNKFVNKSIVVDPASGIVFIAEPNQEPITPDALSSGEQHALALMSRLLFTEAKGTTVLIDEPELSLHVSWQHAMIDDLMEIGRVAGLRFLLATHSTAIVNNRWELVEELGAIDDEA